MSVIFTLTATAAEPSDGYKLYTNEKYGFSVEIPSFMKQHNAADKDPAEGADFWRNPDDIWDINRIAILANDNGYLGDPYTPEKVKMSYELNIEDYKHLGDKGCEDNRYFFIIPSDGHATIECRVFSGMRMVYVTIDFDDDMAEKLGGDVARHIMKSISFK